MNPIIDHFYFFTKTADGISQIQRRSTHDDFALEHESFGSQV